MSLFFSCYFFLLLYVKQIGSVGQGKVPRKLQEQSPNQASPAGKIFEIRLFS